MLLDVHVAFFDIGFPELIVVAIGALLVFGGELPDVMRSVGRAYQRLRKSLQEISQPVREEVQSVSREINVTSRMPSGEKPPPPGEPYTLDQPALPSDAGSARGAAESATDDAPLPAQTKETWKHVLDEPPPV